MNKNNNLIDLLEIDTRRVMTGIKCYMGSNIHTSVTLKCDGKRKMTHEL